jgi:hypothetical protein
LHIRGENKNDDVNIEEEDYVTEEDDYVCTLSKSNVIPGEGKMVCATSFHELLMEIPSSIRNSI